MHLLAAAVQLHRQLERLGAVAAFRRRAYRNRPHWNHELPDGVYDQVVKQLRADGPLTATELGGAKKTSDWWDWSGTKVAVERALMYGEVVCVERRGWKRVYDLAERAVPAASCQAQQLGREAQPYRQRDVLQQALVPRAHPRRQQPKQPQTHLGRR